MQDEIFEDWMAARTPGLLRFAYLVTGSQSAAEEAVQSALARAFERWSWVSRTHDPDAYVRRMVVNAHISGWRKFARRETPVADIRRPASADPEGEVTLADSVWKVCSGLPRQQRAAVVLRFYEDLDYAEIAAILEVAESTVRASVHRALKALRAELEDQETGDE